MGKLAEIEEIGRKLRDVTSGMSVIIKRLCAFSKYNWGISKRKRGNNEKMGSETDCAERKSEGASAREKKFHRTLGQGVRCA